jgi:hypothetical protein
MPTIQCVQVLETIEEEKKIEKVINKHNMIVINTSSPTYQNWKGEETHIYLTICSPSVSIKTNWCVLNSNLGSDHFPISIILGFSLTSENDFKPKLKSRKCRYETLHFAVRIQY